MQKSPGVQSNFMRTRIWNRIVGYSMGAHIVAQLLVLSPGRCLTAVLGGACGRHIWTAEDEQRVEIEAAEMEQGLLKSQILRLWPADQPKPGAAQLEELSARFLIDDDCYALAAIRRSNKDQVVTANQLAAVQVPMLGVVASADPYLASFTELRRLMPRLQLVIINDAHTPQHRASPNSFGQYKILSALTQREPVRDQASQQPGQHGHAGNVVPQELPAASRHRLFAACDLEEVPACRYPALRRSRAGIPGRPTIA